MEALLTTQLRELVEAIDRAWQTSDELWVHTPPGDPAGEWAYDVGEQALRIKRTLTELVAQAPELPAPAPAARPAARPRRGART